MKNFNDFLSESNILARSPKATVDKYNKHVNAEHAALRDKIMAARPHWDRSKLEQIHHSYGLSNNQQGLDDIHSAIQSHDKIDAQFKK